MGSETPPGDLSVVEVLERFGNDGWSVNHVRRSAGAMKCGNCSEESKRGEIEVDALHRVEGSSDPDDLQMVVGITCSRCGTAGAVVLAYGPNASEEDAEFLAELDLDDVTDPVAAETD